MSMKRSTRVSSRHLKTMATWRRQKRGWLFKRDVRKNLMKENPMAKKKEYTCVLVETDNEGITWITFNRPEKRNAMNPTLHVEMEEILYGLETDEATKVIVLTGAGNSWSAGMDLKQYFRETDNDPGARFRAATAHRRWATELLTWSRKPSIAMVNGYCYGGAFVSLAACDIVIAAENATFGLFRGQLGDYPRRQREQSLRRHGFLSERFVLCDDRPHHRRPQGSGIGHCDLGRFGG